jgi:isocitrate dehydrogenase
VSLSQSCGSPSRTQTTSRPANLKGTDVEVIQRDQEQSPAFTARSCGTTCSRKVAADYPDVETESVLVDAMAANFVLHPEDLSVVVASNLSADILSDLGSARPAALVSPRARTSTRSAASPACSSPSTAAPPTSPGRASATPSAPSAAPLLLEHFGLNDEAKAVQHAIEDVTGNGIPLATSGAPLPPQPSSTISPTDSPPHDRHSPDASRLGASRMQYR